MALIEISTVATDTIDVTNDYIPFVDVSETPDGTNKATFASIFGADLVAIRALSPSNDDILQRKAGAWTNRTIAQLKTDLAYTIPVASDTAYDATSWNGNTDVPTKNAVRDKIETMGGGGITNSAANNVMMKSDGTNAITSTLSQSGSTITLGSAADAGTTIAIPNSASSASMLSNVNGLFLGHSTGIFFGDADQFPIWGSWQPDGLHLDQGQIQMVEITAPGAGAANSVRIYAEDNGSGKTRLMAIFASGASQQLAIQP